MFKLLHTIALGVVLLNICGASANEEPQAPSTPSRTNVTPPQAPGAPTCNRTQSRVTHVTTHPSCELFPEDDDTATPMETDE